MAIRKVSKIDEDFVSFFEKFFEPNKDERLEYEVGTWWWMESKNRTYEQNRQDRVLALLFADLMWRDEHER